QHHYSTAALKKLLKDGAVLAGNLHPVSGEDDEHIGLRQLIGRREGHRAVGFESALLEQRHPVLEELRVVVLARAVRFDASADEDAEGFGGADRRAKRENRQGTEEQSNEVHGRQML